MGMKGCPSAASQRKRNVHAPSDSAELSGSVPRRKACGCVAGQTERARRRGRNRAACAESRFNKTEIKAGVLEGKVVDVAAVNALASLPSREALVAKVLGSMNAPITGFVTALSGNIRNLLYVLNAIGEKKSA